MSTGQTVYFHIGMGKTGSSFIQSSLALSVDRLIQKGIFYPIDLKDASAASKGLISSGNLKLRKGIENSGLFQEAMAGVDRMLFSNETIHQALRQLDGGLGVEIRKAFPEASLKFLCYIRDPIDHAVSCYHQAVKRGGYTENCAAFLLKYNTLNHIPEIAQKIDEIGGELTVFNYSRHRDDLLETFGTWLGISPGTLLVPSNVKVNRSLTLAELELQRALNKHLGQKSARLVSDPLCNRLPNIKSDFPPLGLEDLSRFIARMSRAMDNPRLREIVPPEEMYRIGPLDEYAERFPNPDTELDMKLSVEQIAVVAQSIASVFPADWAKTRIVRAGQNQRTGDSR